jgi:hypothetical protein
METTSVSAFSDTPSETAQSWRSASPLLEEQGGGRDALEEP